MIKFIEFGNIFKIEDVNNYAHGCNCAGAMGKGIALDFKRRFPLMYKEYKLLCSEKEFKLGDIFPFFHEGGYVFNLGTQKTWRTKSDYQAIRESIEKMFIFCSENKVAKVAIPKIGAGLGRGNWEVIKSDLVEISNNYPDTILYVVENFKDIRMALECSRPSNRYR